MNTFELTLNDKALAKRHKMLDKLSRAEEQLASLVLYHQSNPSYMEKRDNDSVMSFQHRLDALNREEEEAVAKFREQFRARRDNIQRRLEEAKQRQEIHKTTKPKVIHAAETSVKLILMEMDSNGLLSPKDRQRLLELRGEQPAPSNTAQETTAAPPPPPKEEELPLDVKEFLTERGTMPANREELDLFKERKEMLKEMAREKRERERQEEEKRLEAIEQKKLAEEAARQRQAAKKEKKEEEDYDTEIEEEEDEAIRESAEDEIAKRKRYREERKKHLQKQKEPPSDSETEEEEEDGYTSEEIRQAAAAQKEMLRKKHEERMKIFAPMTSASKLITNTKVKKQIKMTKH